MLIAPLITMSRTMFIKWMINDPFAHDKRVVPL